MALVYNFCFWFSLRLGGILIGIFSLASCILILCSFAYNHTKQVKDEITYWINNYNLIYAEDYLVNFKEEPSKHIVFIITLTCIYIFVCLLFIYGAYMCNNVLMVAYILMEILRLVVILVLVATGLLLIKQNTMDIGILIGASVAGGFLLCMFYLWICAANLPVLINEMERDEQADTIAKLRQLLEAKTQGDITRSGINSTPIRGKSNFGKTDIFIMPNNRLRYIKPKVVPPRISVGY